MDAEIELLPYPVGVVFGEDASSVLLRGMLRGLKSELGWDWDLASFLQSVFMKCIMPCETRYLLDHGGWSVHERRMRF